MPVPGQAVLVSKDLQEMPENGLHELAERLDVQPFGLRDPGPVGEADPVSGQVRQRGREQRRGRGPAPAGRPLLSARDGPGQRLGVGRKLFHERFIGPSVERGGLAQDAAGGAVTPGLVDPHTHLVPTVTVPRARVGGRMAGRQPIRKNEGIRISRVSAGIAAAGIAVS